MGGIAPDAIPGSRSRLVAGSADGSGTVAGPTEPAIPISGRVHREGQLREEKGLKTAAAERPYIAHSEYGIPEHEETLTEWSWVVDRLRSERNYWICTSSLDGRPHARPAWGVFVEDTLCFGGGPRTRWSRNLAVNPQVSVHLESATQVVIAEGTVHRLTERSDPRLATIDDAYEMKYEMRHGPPIWMLKPSVVIAWTEFPESATRFRL
jgi:Pyridoxamine 5'-phosphate oxidase